MINTFILTLRISMIVVVFFILPFVVSILISKIALSSRPLRRYGLVLQFLDNFTK